MAQEQRFEPVGAPDMPKGSYSDPKLLRCPTAKLGCGISFIMVIIIMVDYEKKMAEHKEDYEKQMNN